MASLMRAARFERCVQTIRQWSWAAARADRINSMASNSQKAINTPGRPAPTQACTTGRRACARARPVPRLAVARFATESEVVEVRDDGVVVPELGETLEWVLDSPPPLHQFEESPIIVEIAGIEPAASR